MAVVISLPLLGMSGVASAKAAKGCHKTHSCKSVGGGTSGSGTGADPAPITVQIDPNPLVETGQSDVVATVQVETSPSFAGDEVDISSSQLLAACQGDVAFESLQGTGGTSIEVTLDDDGNVTVLVQGIDCAPGPSVFDASLAVAPYDTALGTLVANPPVVTAAGVFGYPTTSGTVSTGEVETGDTAGLGLSTTPVTLFSSSTPGFDSFLAAVPPTICAVTITASGGQGGNAADGTPGGDAASVTATVPITPGSVVDVEVGGAGASEGAFSAGGTGGGGGGNAAGGGGGASAVSASGSPLVVAGAGGGGGDSGSPGGAAGTLGKPGATGGGAFGNGGSGGSPSGDGGVGGSPGGGGGGGVAINGGSPGSGGAGGGGNGSVGGGGGGAGNGLGGGVGGAVAQTGASGTGLAGGGVGDDNGGNGGTADLVGGGGGGGIGFGGGGGGFLADGGGGAGYGAGGGGYGPSAGGGGGSSYVTTSVIGTPTSSDTSTGDGSVTISYDPATDSCGVSDVYAVFYVETSPVYAEQPVEISSPELQSRCGLQAEFDTPTGLIHDDGVTTTLDDDGNAVFYFMGASCAAGSSVVTADVEAGSHPTYTTTFNIVAPQPTI
jgi:hypothetical protein